MDVLFIVPYVPDLVRVRPYNLIRALTARGHRLTLMTLWSKEIERAAAERLKGVCHEVFALPLPPWRSMVNCLKTLPTELPLQSAYCWHPALANQIKQRMNTANGGRRIDIVHVEHLRGARYGMSLKCGAGGAPVINHRAPVVWDSVDSISHLFRQAAAHSRKLLNRWVTRFELGRTERFEGWLVNQFDRTLVTSQADKQALSELAHDRNVADRVTVLPNGVDLDYFHPIPDDCREPDTLVISGKMSYHANVSMALYFVKEILPLIREKLPEVKLWIAGKDPTPEIQSLGQDPGITISGTVEDIRPYLQRAAAAVVPLTYGAGIQNKVLEAMACATPVVSTPRAIAALSTQPGCELLAAQEPESFAQEVLKLLEDPVYRRSIGHSGRRYVEMYHQWTNIAVNLEGVYNEVLNTRPPVRWNA